MPRPTVLRPDGQAVRSRICSVIGAPAIHGPGSDFRARFSRILFSLPRHARASTAGNVPATTNHTTPNLWPDDLDPMTWAQMTRGGPSRRAGLPPRLPLHFSRVPGTADRNFPERQASVPNDIAPCTNAVRVCSRPCCPQLTIPNSDSVSQTGRIGPVTRTRSRYLRRQGVSPSDCSPPRRSCVCAGITSRATDTAATAEDRVEV